MGLSVLSIRALHKEAATVRWVWTWELPREPPQLQTSPAPDPPARTFLFAPTQSDRQGDGNYSVWIWTQSKKRGAVHSTEASTASSLA
jgi:hypothetical protein